MECGSRSVLARHIYIPDSSSTKDVQFNAIVGNACFASQKVRVISKDFSGSHQCFSRNIFSEILIVVIGLSIGKPEKIEVLAIFFPWPNCRLFDKIQMVIGFFTKSFSFYQKFRYLPKLSIFTKILDFYQNFKFLPKASIFTKFFDFYQNFHFLPKFSIFSEFRDTKLSESHWKAIEKTSKHSV